MFLRAQKHACVSDSRCKVGEGGFIGRGTKHGFTLINYTHQVRILNIGWGCILFAAFYSHFLARKELIPFHIVLLWIFKKL